MSWWRTGRPSMLRFMGSQRVGHDWATERNRIFHQQGVHIIGVELNEFWQTEPTHVTSTQFQKQNLLAPRAFLCSVLSLPCHKEDITHTRTPEVSFVCFCISWKQRIVQFILFDSVFFHSTLCLWGSSVLLRVIRSFILTAMRYSIVWLYPNLCIHLIFVGHLGRFPFGLLNWSCCKHCCLNNQWKGSPIIKVHKRKSQDQ